MPNPRPPYPPEFRAEAVRLYRSSGKSLKAVCDDLGISLETLRSWVPRRAHCLGPRVQQSGGFGTPGFGWAQPSLERHLLDKEPQESLRSSNYSGVSLKPRFESRPIRVTEDGPKVPYSN